MKRVVSSSAVVVDLKLALWSDLNCQLSLSHSPSPALSVLRPVEITANHRKSPTSQPRTKSSSNHAVTPSQIERLYSRFTSLDKGDNGTLKKEDFLRIPELAINPLGERIVQSFFDEANDWGIATLERAAEGLKAETAVHICYGYGIKANTDWKKTLGSEWRQYEETFPNLQKSAIDIISLECQNSRVPMDLIELIRGKKVMVGAIDVATDTVETPEQVADTLRNALRFVDADKLYPATNCGMAPLSRAVAQGKLKALGAGADIVRKELAA